MAIGRALVFRCQLHLAFCGRTPRKAQLRADAEESTKNYPLAFMFPATTLGGSGKVVAKQRSMLSTSQDDKESTVLREMFRNASRGKTDIPWNWWSDIEAGGGALGAIGSHAIDGFHWFLDTDITEVFCLLKANVKEREDSSRTKPRVTTDDETNMILKFADSELTQNASGTASLSVVEAGKYDFNCKIFGTEGSIIVGESGELWHATIGSNKWEEIEIDLGEAPPNTKAGGWSRGFMNFSREIVAALMDGKTEIPHAATFEDGWKIQRVLDACRESNETGRMINMS